jgi:hypothetical protein
MTMRRPLSRAALLSALAWGVGALLAGQTIGSVQESQAMVGVRGLVVPPVARTDIANMVDTGIIDAEGYTHVTLNLAGELKSAAARDGAIVAVLIPVQPPFDFAFETLGLLPAALEVSAPASAHGGLYVMAKQATLEVGFPKYRVLLYNTTGAGASVALFAYRTRR